MALGAVLLLAFTAGQAFGKEETFGYSMGGIDHLADNLSVTDFWVNGAAGQQAGNGNAGVPAPPLPAKWRPGLTVHVVWDVRDWQHDKGSTHQADVSVDPYSEDGGNLWVHFLANGTVRVVVSELGPRAAGYPGPHDPIPSKEPWNMYPSRIAYSDVGEQLLDTQLIHQHCDATSNPVSCVKQAHERLLDEERVDARRYLPQCASITNGSSYDECMRRAYQSMRAARLARRCHVAPGLPDCKSSTNAKDPQRAAGALVQ
ncbi:DUF3304 domain-containing protein [Paraburkholderia sp. J94]|uniref:DUF3304 domain-containing protein n=1 Tax=Paraburkholderia sp. J94 TaxID=2805441 RepID=UPI002AB17188|nr:DUF3304 domain-containing protein [Paraburkholderia sp. J94]